MKTISAAELDIMLWIWDQQERVTSADITRHFSSLRHWKPATISTFLGRLTEKGYLQAVRDGRSFRYLPLISKDSYQRIQARDFIQENYNGSLKNLIAAYTGLIRNPDELHELKEWFNNQFLDDGENSKENS